MADSTPNNRSFGSDPIRSDPILELIKQRERERKKTPQQKRGKLKTKLKISSIYISIYLSKLSIFFRFAESY